MAKFFLYPFATGGDKTAIPNATQPSGSMSYNQGFGLDYQLNQATDPQAKPIPRDQFNQLMFDVTDAIRQYQTNGFPDWITSADNGGVPFEYPLFAIVRYDAGGGVQLYENQVADNTATPGADATWTVISGNVLGVPAGTTIDFSGVVPPVGYLNTDGSAVNRVTYASLLLAITFAQIGTLTNGANTVSGLTSTVDMFVGMAVEGTNIPAGTTVASIVDGTDITLSQNATASGAVSITFFPHGAGNGTTTFNIPDYRRRTLIGSGGSASTDPLGIGNKVGQKGGEEGHVQTLNELVSHNHDYNILQNTGNQLQGNPGWTTVTGQTGSRGGGQAFNIIQPSAVTRKCIKF